MSDEYMCPFCVTPWKCNGPHIEPEDMTEFKAALEQEYANGKSHGLLEGWSGGIEEGYIAGLEMAIAAIQAMPTIEDQMEYVYLDLPVPEILAILKDILKDTQ